MTRYADPQRCPDCLEPIAYGSTSCPSCGLSLEGPLAGRLFQALSSADDLLLALRATRNVVPAIAANTPGPPETELVLGPPTTAPHRSRGLSAVSVPKILLGLGAVCLLVAALVFLAVTWSVMGVAGRTATLVGFTVIAAGLAAWVAHRDLRAAAESLSLVALGLLAFDVFGARDSGWFGDISTPGFFVVLGAVMLVAGAGAALAVRRTPTGALSAAEVIAALGLGSMTSGQIAGDWFALSAALTVGTVLAMAGAFAAHHLRLAVLTIGAAAVASLAWVMLVATSFDRAVSHPSAHELWLEAEAWPLLASAAIVGGLAVLRFLPTGARVTGLAIAEVIVSSVLLVPFSQDTSTKLTIAVLVLLAAACALTWFTEKPWSWACSVTTSIGGAWMALVTAQLAALALIRVAEAGAELWGGKLSSRLPQASAVGGDGVSVGGGFGGDNIRFDADPSAWLLPIVAVAVFGTAIVLARTLPAGTGLVARFADPVVVIAVAAVVVVATVALYPVPVWLVLALMLLPALVFTSWALHRQSAASLVVGSLFLSGAVATSLHDEWLTAGALLVALGLSTVVFLRWAQSDVSGTAGALLSLAAAGSVWTWAAIADADQPWTALVILLLLGGLVVAAPLSSWLGRHVSEGRFVGVEIGAAFSVVVAALAGGAAAPYALEATWTAVYLTVAGATVSVMSLLRDDRRSFGWPGGLLLAIASWIRLWDVGVETPEWYTLPSAVVLVVVGLMHLRAHPSASTMTALSPGLALGLVPSLLWVLWDPVTVRSALLGLGCLALVGAGLRLRWTAPVVFAATVGALLVLRHATPIAEAVPRWGLIASAGVILVAVGITWERRIMEARAVAGYVRALR